MKRSFAILVIIVMAIVMVSCSSEGGIGVVEVNPYVLFMNIIQNGDFWMGDTRNLSAAGSAFKPHHRVTLTYDFYMQRLEVTNSDYLEFLNDNPVSPTGFMNGHNLLGMGSVYCEFVHVGGAFRLANTGKANYPVHCVSWWGAIEYCNWMSRERGLEEAYNTNTGELTGSGQRQARSVTQVEGFRLPTEAEWEYAARGAENDYFTAMDFLFAGGNTLNSFGWYLENSFETDHPIVSNKGTHIGGGKTPNEIGLFDMSGNVEEWCHDWYSESYYSVSPDQNPSGPTRGTCRVTRGGGWNSMAAECITFYRKFFEPDQNAPSIGFRMAKTM